MPIDPILRARSTTIRTERATTVRAEAAAEVAVEVVATAGAIQVPIAEAEATRDLITLASTLAPVPTQAGAVTVSQVATMSSKLRTPRPISRKRPAIANLRPWIQTI